MLDNRTIGDSVYEKIKYDIVHLTLKPGEKLSEASLAEKYGISKAPIRVALRKLSFAHKAGVLFRRFPFLVPSISLIFDFY